MSTAYHPRTDGQSEVANKAIIQKIKKLVYDGDSNWLHKLPHILAVLNRVKNSSRNATPFEIVTGRNPRLIGDLATKEPIEMETLKQSTQNLKAIRNSTRTNLAKAKIDQAKQSNKRRRPAPDYNIGDKVLLSTKNLPLATSYRKTSPTWIGPLTIISANLDTDNYTLELLKELSKVHPTFHVELRKAYIPNDDTKFPSRKNTKPGPLLEF